MPDDEAGKILENEKIFFAENHLDPLSIKALTLNATFLGAAVVSSPDEATITIYNPGSPHFRPITGMPCSTPQKPYHWLTACRIAGKKVEDGELSPSTPFMQHSSTAKVGVPVHIYVSKNVYRDPDQLDAPMWRIIGDKLAAVGAIIVQKRAEADVLVVDRKSDFYRTKIKAEIEKYKRTHQRVAERPWVDQCLAEGRYLSISTGEMEEAERQQREDSFAAEDVVKKPKGGHPVGKPRMEYTPADDEFLCRYLAAYHPGGSWGSRRTYQTLVEQGAMFPKANRHTAQSWHERFKKNSMPFSRRVERYIDEGIDANLETVAERTRKKEGKGAVLVEEAGTPVSDKGKGKEKAPVKRKLVELGSDDEQAREKRATIVGRSARIDALGPAPEFAQPTLVSPEPESSKAETPAPAKQPEAAPVPQPEAAPAAPPEAVPAPLTETAPVPVVFEPDPDILPAASSTVIEKSVEMEMIAAGHNLTVTESRSEVVVQVSAPPSAMSTPTPASPVRSAPKSAPARVRPVFRTPQPAKPEPKQPGTPKHKQFRASTMEIVDQVSAPQSAISTPTPASPRSAPKSAPAKVRPASPPQPANPPAQPGTPKPKRPRVSAPGALPASPPPQGKPEPSTPTHKRYRESEPAGLHDGSPSRQRLDHAIAVAQAHKEVFDHKRRKSVDTVNRKAAMPSFSHQPSPASTPRQALRGQEAAEAYAAGEKISTNARDVYRARIMQYTAKYGVSIGELGRAVSEIAKDAKDAKGMFWDEVDRGLKAKYGF